MLVLVTFAAACVCSGVGAFSTIAPTSITTRVSPVALRMSAESNNEDDEFQFGSRRSFVKVAFGTALSVAAVESVPLTASATTGSGDGLLPDLPPEAVRSYLQYRLPLQLSADYYLWELQDKVADKDEWGEVNQLFRVNNNKGQGQPSRIERDFVNPMRILTLSMPPDVSEDMRDAQFKFEKAAAGISKVTAGVSRDMPVELEKGAIPAAKAKWEDGRVALNEFFAVLNTATGLNELKPVPPAGPNQNKEYGRNQLKYLDLAKKTKLCQNRGGPALSQAWGQLMVSGYMQDSCGIPDMDAYFYQ